MSQSRRLAFVHPIESLEVRRMLSGVTVGFSDLPLDFQPSTGVLTQELVPGGVMQRRISQSRPSAGAPALGVPLVGDFDIVLKMGPNLLANAAASAAFEEAAVFIESLFSDPVTVVIDAEIESMGFSILGSALPVSFTFEDDAFNDIRNAMVLDADGDETIVSLIPDFDNFTALVPFDAADPWEVVGMEVNRANLLALGFDPNDAIMQSGPLSQYDPSVKRDADILFNSDFDFDYDRSDGITPGFVDFIGVAIHELGHALGFVSAVDFVDRRVFFGDEDHTILPTTLDLFRLRPGDGNANFAGAPRILTPGFDEEVQVFYDGGIFDPIDFDGIIDDLELGDIPMSTGANTGDFRQASHWKDDGLTGVTIGIMDPRAPDSIELPFEETDSRALRLIGWDGVSPLGNGRARIAADEPTVLEDAGVVTFTVRRINGTVGAVTVDFTTTNGTATAGEDYVAQSGTLSFADGESEMTITVTLLDDTTLEDSETFSVELSNPQGGLEINGTGIATVTIIEDDAFVRFASSTYTVREGDGLATITLARGGSPLDTISVDFATSDGTATAGLDYLAGTGTVTFLPNELSKTFTVVILQDVLDQEEIETVILSLLTPSDPSVSIGEPSTAILNIRSLDTTPPQVASTGFTNDSRGRFESVTFTFNEAINFFPSDGNFQLFSRNNEGAFGSGRRSRIPIKAASYNSDTRTISIIPKKRFANNKIYQLILNSAGGITDRGGNRLDSNADGIGGDPFSMIFARGNKISYVDRDGDQVQLRLQGAGYMELTRRLDGEGDTLSLFDTTAGSILTGTVKPRAHGGGGTGATSLSLLDPDNAQNQLTDPPFSIVTIVGAESVSGGLRGEESVDGFEPGVKSLG